MPPAKESGPYGIEDAPGRSLLERTVALLLRRHLAVLAVGAVVTALAAWAASKLPLVTDFAELLPENASSVVELGRGKTLLGNTANLVLLVEGNDEAALRQAVEALAGQFKGHPEFAEVIYRLPKEFFERRALHYLTVRELEELRDTIADEIKTNIRKNNPLFIDLEDAPATPARRSFQALLDGYKKRGGYKHEYFQSDDGRGFVMLVRPRAPATDIKYAKQVLKIAREKIAAAKLAAIGPGIEVTLAGNYFTVVEENDVTRRDLAAAGTISGVLLLLIITWYFRRPLPLLYIFVPLIAGTIWTSGFAYLAVGRLNTISGFIFGMLAGMGIEYGIHIYLRFALERELGAPVFQAALTNLRETGRASLGSMFTTSAGFFVILFADFKGFSEFGVIAGFGIILCLAAVVLLQTSLIGLVHRFAPAPPPSTAQKGSPATRALVALFQRPGAIAAVSVVMVGVGAAASSQMGFEYDFRKLRGGSPETLAVQDRFHAILGQSTTPVVYIAGNVEEARRITESCQTRTGLLHGDRPIHRCASMSTVIPPDQDAKLPVIREIRDLLPDDKIGFLKESDREQVQKFRDNLVIEPITREGLPPEFPARFEREGGKQLVFIYPAQDLWDGRRSMDFAAAVREVAHMPENDIGPIGTAVVMADVLRIIWRDGKTVLILLSLVLFVILMVDFRSARKAALVYAPLLAATAIWTGAMVFLDLKIGFYNMVVFPTLLGSSIDNGIHLVHRYFEEGRGSMDSIMHSTGAAVNLSVMTNIAGFAGLAVATHQGLRGIGITAVLGFLSVWISAMLFFPAWVKLLEQRWPALIGAPTKRHERISVTIRAQP